MHYTWITATDQRTYKQRLRILDDIEDRPLGVDELARLHQVSRNTVRRHIQELRREGVMIRHNPSDKRYYSAEAPQTSGFGLRRPPILASGNAA